MRSKIIVLLLALLVGCSSTGENTLDPCEEWKVADVSATSVKHLSFLRNGEKSVHEIPVESVHNYFLLRQFEIQEHRLVSYLLARHKKLPESVFEGSPKVSMLCAIVASNGSKTIVKHLQLQFVGRRIARVLNSNPELRLDASQLIVVGRYDLPMARNAIWNDSRSRVDFEIACERFGEFQRRLAEEKQ